MKMFFANILVKQCLLVLDNGTVFIWTVSHLIILIKFGILL